MTSVCRQVLGIKRLSLTDVKVEGLSRGAKITNIEKQWKEQGVLGQWEASAWAKKIQAKKTRASLTDFDRFKVMLAKKQRATIIKDKLATMK